MSQVKQICNDCRDFVTITKILLRCIKLQGFTCKWKLCPVLCPPDVKNWLIGKDADAGKLKAGDGWMASPTRWTWVWASSGSWWWTGKPDVLHSMGSPRVRHNWATELKSLVNKILWLKSQSIIRNYYIFQLDFKKQTVISKFLVFKLPKRIYWVI